MKVIITDNFDRESMSDELLVGNLSKRQAEVVANALNKDGGECSPYFYRAVEDDYELYIYDPNR